MAVCGSDSKFPMSPGMFEAGTFPAMWAHLTRFYAGGPHLAAAWGFIGAAQPFAQASAPPHVLSRLTSTHLQWTSLHVTTSCTCLVHQGKADRGVGCLLRRVHAQVISGPIASALLLADGAGGLKGWQWLFLIEGIPTIVLGFWVGSPL